MRYAKAIGYVLALALCCAAGTAPIQAKQVPHGREAALTARPYVYKVPQVAADTSSDAPSSLAPDGAFLYPQPTVAPLLPPGGTRTATAAESGPGGIAIPEPSYQAASEALMRSWLAEAGWQGAALEEALRSRATVTDCLLACSK